MAGHPLDNPLSSSQPANPLGNPLAGPSTLDNDPRVVGMETTGAGRFDTNAFGRGLARGSDQVKGSIGEFANLLGNLTDSEGLTSYGAKLIDNASAEAALNPAEIQEMDDLDSFADFGTFAAEALASQVPQLASMIGTGGLTGLGAKGVAKVFGKKLARNAAGLNMAAETAKKAGAFTRGFKAGAFADLYAQSVGEVATELRDNGINPNATALVGGAAIAALDFASLGAIYKTFGLAKDFKTANGLVNNVMRGMSKGAVTEAPTEALQEAIVVATAMYNDPDAKLGDIVSEENMKRYGFAGLAGAVVGGALGGAGGVSTYVGQANEAAEQKRPLFGDVSEGDLLAAARAEPGDASFTVDAEGNVTGQAATQDYGPVERPALEGPSEADLLEAARAGGETFDMSLNARGYPNPASVREAGRGPSLFSPTQDEAPEGRGPTPFESDPSRRPQVQGESQIAMEELLAAARAPDVEDRELQDRGADVREQDIDRTQIVHFSTPRARKDASFVDFESGIEAREDVDLNERNADVEQSIARDARLIETKAKGIREASVAVEGGAITVSNLGSEGQAKVAKAQMSRGLTKHFSFTIEQDELGGWRVVAAPRDSTQDVFSTEAQAEAYLAGLRGQVGEDIDLRVAPASEVGVQDAGFVVIEEARSADAAGNLDYRVRQAIARGLLQARNVADPAQRVRVTRPRTDGLAGTAVDLPISSIVRIGRAANPDVEVVTSAQGERGADAYALELFLSGLRELLSRGMLPADFFTQDLGNKILSDKGTRLTLRQAASSAQNTTRSEAIGQQRDIAARAEGRATRMDRLERDVDGSVDEFGAPTEDNLRAMAADGRFDVREEQERELGDGDFDDGATRGIDREAERDPLAGEQREASQRGPDQVSYFGTLNAGNARRVERLVDFAQAIVRDLGLKRSIRFVLQPSDVASLKGRYAKVKDPFIRDELARIEREQPPARIVIPKSGSVIIWVNPKAAAAEQFFAVAHELGHLVQYEVLNNLDPVYRKFLEKTLGTGREFEENFADQLYLWLNKRARENPGRFRNAQTKAERDQLKAENPIAAFFESLAGKIERLWQATLDFIRKERPKADLDASYARFMEAMVGARMVREGRPRPANSVKEADLIERINEIYDANTPPKSRSQAALDMSVDPREVGDRVSGLKAGAAARAKRLFRDMRDDGPSMFGKASNLWKVLDSQLRNMDSRVATLIADHFRRVPGQTNSTVEGATVGEDIQRVRAKLEVKSRVLMNRHRERLGMPQANPWTLLRESVGLGKPAALPAKYKAYQQALKYQTPLDQIEDAEVREMVSEVREYYKEALLEFNRHLRKAGKTIKARKNYSPVWFHMASIEKDAGGFKAKLAEAFNLQPGSNAVEDLYNKIVHASGAFDPEATSPEQQEREEDPDVVGFASADPRNITPAQIRVLEDFLMDDVWGVMGLYTYSGTRYSVIASRFGAKVIKPRGSTEVFLADEVDVEDGVVYFDPLAKLKGSVRAAEDLTDDQKQRIMQKILPAYMGVLGLRDLDPRARSLMEALNTYQNLRLLPFLVLSSLPDIAGPAIRAGDANAYMALGEVLGQDKEKLRELAVMIGAIEENVANNILSEEIVNGSHNSVTRRINDWFFWANQTKRLTDMTRVMAMVVARDFMAKHGATLLRDPSNEASKRHLEELQITPEQIDAWNRDTRPDAEKVQDPEHIAYITATNRFIDGAVLRPDASVKPGWMSDHRFQLLAYLKSFMFAFHQVMIRRAMENVARADGATGKAEQVLIATAPLIVLGLLGYELRRLLAGGQVPDRLSMEYLMVGVDKAGLLGPMAILFDGARGRQYGTPTGLNALGPTATQAWGFLDPSWNDVARAVPLVSSSPYLRDALLG